MPTDHEWLIEIAEWLECIKTEKKTLEEIQNLVSSMRLHLEKEGRPDFIELAP